MTFARLLLVSRMRLRALFQRERLDAELDEELQDHLLRQMDANVRGGMLPTEARRAALLAIGGLERRKEEVRDARGIVAIETLLQDLRYAWRALSSKPGFTAAVVLALGLGIGANTAMFGILDRLMFRPPSLLHAPERVHRVYLGWTSQGFDQIDRKIGYKRFVELSQWGTAFEGSAAAAYRLLAVRIGDDVREMTVAAVSADFFELFDAQATLGRFFSAEEDRVPAGAPVVVLSYGLWQSQYGRDPDVLGRRIDVGNATYTIIGVAPRGLVGITDGPAPGAFIPITAFGYEQSKDYYQNHGWTWLEMFVRRKPDVTVQAATADLTSAFQRSWGVERERTNLAPLDVARPRAIAGNVLLSRGPEASPESRIVTLTTGVAVIVLLIACANVANLLLARAVGRRREIALRLALGVTRRRLVQQLLTESLLLAGLGGLVGLAAAQWGGGALRALLLRAEDANAVVTDARTLVFVVTLALCVALVTGLSPAVHALRGDLTDALKAGAREGHYRRSRLRTGLLLFQAALSTVLLVGAGLFVRSLENVRTMRLGFDADSVIYAEASMRGTRLPDVEQNAFNERLVNAARTVPGVRSASLTVSVPFGRDFGRGTPFVPGVDSVRKLGRFTSQAGSPSYFATMGTRILRGRGISDDDRPGTPRVLVISESMAKALWPKEEALGKQIRIGLDTAPLSSVVGIAEDLRGRDVRGDAEFWYYMPIAQYVSFYRRAEPTLVVRVDGRAVDYAEGLRRRLQREVPGAAFVRTQPLSELVEARQRPWRIGATMFVAFGALALVLAAIGLYSVISYGVAQRTQELGVRMALGASSGAVIRMVVSQGVGFAVGGIAIGSIIGLLAGKWVEPMLFSQPARDPRVFGFVSVVLFAVAIAATLRPALRATRVDPTVALRSE